MSLVLIPAALISGLELGSWLPLPAGLAVGAGFMLSRRTVWFAVLILVGVVLGVAVVRDWKRASTLQNQPGLVSGRVVQMEDRAGLTGVRLQVKTLEQRSVRFGAVAASVRLSEAVRLHQVVTVFCPRWQVKPSSAPLTPPKSLLLCSNADVVRQSPPPLVLQWLALARQRFVDALERTLPEPTTSVAIGLTLGETRSLPPDIVEAFRLSGTSHILALSGYNVSILVAFFLALLPPVIGRRPAFVLIAVFLLAFLVLTGVPASLLRATGMASLLLVARWVGRRASAGRLLALVVTLLLVVQPSLLADIGFLLSAVSTWGLIALAPRLEERLRLPSFLRVSLGTTLAAFLFTLPILLPTFGRLALVAPLANLLVAPLVPLLFFASLGFGLAGLIVPSLTVSLAEPFVWLNEVFLSLIQWSAALPFASVSVRLPSVLPALVPAIFLAGLIRSKSTRCRRCDCGAARQGQYG